MHKSKLAGFIIDCQTADLQVAASFWGAVLGMPPESSQDKATAKYISLVDPTAQLHIEVQSVDHPSRVHLDIETDDVEAEVRRLEGLGAKRFQTFKTWVVMEAPTGQRFCVVRVKSENFQATANTWT